MICPFCKHEIPDNTKFCPNCGQTVVQQSEQNGTSASYWRTVESEAVRDNEIRRDAENKAIDERRKKRHMMIGCLVGVGIVALLICYFTIIRPEQRYQSATELFESGQYNEAMEIFGDLGSYKDSSEQVEVCADAIRQEQYQEAVMLYDGGQFDEALTLFEELSDFSDSKEYIVNCQTRIMQEIAPAYEWSFDENLSESNGTESTAYGDTTIMDLGGVSVATFDGDGDYIFCGNGLNMTDDYTFNTVIRCQDIYKDYSAFFAKYETNGEGPYAFSINQGYVNCWVTDADGYHIEIESETKLENNRWYCISIVRSGETISLYINGKFEGQDSVSRVMQNTDAVTIGRQALMFEPEDQLQFTGYIKSIEIYDYAFTAEQIEMLSNISLSSEVSDSAVVVDVPSNAFNWSDHYYACFNNCSSWEEAESYCESRGGHLATITSSDENDAVFGYLLSCGYESGYFGYTDNIDEGSWYWVNGETSGYTNWHSGEPNAESSNEDYAMFYYKFDDGTWNDGNFGNGTANDDAIFICEWD